MGSIRRGSALFLVFSLCFGAVALAGPPPATPLQGEAAPPADPAAEACAERPEEPGSKTSRIVHECMTRAGLGGWDDFFPKGYLDDRLLVHNTLACWYGCSLRAMAEPSLQAAKNPPGTQAYRFLWLRTWDPPVAVRLSVAKEGTGTLAVRITNGRGGAYPGALANEESRRLSKAEVDGWLAKLAAANFWMLPSFQREPGEGGAQWLVEGLKDGQYHLVDRWSPPEGPIRDLGLEMLKLTGRSFEKTY